MKTIIYISFFFSFAPLALFAQHAGSTLKFAPNTEDRVIIPDNPDGLLDVANGFTIEAWFRHDGDPNNEDGKIYAKAADDAFENSVILGSKFGEILFEVFKGDFTTNGFQLSGGTIGANRWHHVAATYEVGGKARIYINGEMVAEGDAMSGDHSYNTNPAYIGVLTWNSGILFELNGDIDEFRYWQTPLEEATINDWMLKYVDDTHPNFNSLSVYFKFDEGSGTDVTDDGATGANTGTLDQGPVWVESTAPFSGDFQFFSSDVVGDLTGAWNGHETAESDIFSIQGTTLEGIASVLIANDEAGYNLVPFSSGNIDQRLEQRWKTTTTNSPFGTVQIDLSSTGVDLSQINSVNLMASDNPDMSNPFVFEPGTLVGNVYTLENMDFRDNEFLTLGFETAVSSSGEELAPSISVVATPNPSAGLFQINLRQQATADLNIQISDSSCRVYLEKSFGQVGQQFTENIDLSDAPTGVYFLRAISGEKVSTKRLVVQR